jgi:hypothetical protein
MGKSAPTPDNAAVISAQASATAAQDNYNLGEQQLQFSQQQWNQEQPEINAVTTAEANAENSATNFSNEQQALYTGTYAPEMQSYATQAQNWASPDQLAVNAGAAQANVADNMASQKQAAQTQLEGYGVDPTSTRYAALDYGYNAATGAAEAGAGTTALQNTKLQGLGLEANSIAQGQGLPGNTSSLTNAATGSGSASTSAADTNLNTAATTAADSTAFTNAGTSAENAQVSAVNGFNTSMEQGYTASQTGAAGLGSAVGGVLGSIGGSNPTTGASTGLIALGLARGGPTQAIPTDSTPGGAVPTSASPSRGSNSDDVPARLTANEYVIPKDVALWLGQKHLTGVVDKARQEQQESQQRSDLGGRPAQAIPTAPRFISRPAQGNGPGGTSPPQPNVTRGQAIPMAA